MTTNSTPPTEQVREAYATRMSPAQDTLRRPMFDRWLATVKAEAWDEGVAAQSAMYHEEPDAGPNPYRETGAL